MRINHPIHIVFESENPYAYKNVSIIDNMLIRHDNI